MTAITVVTGQRRETIGLVDLEGALRRALHSTDPAERLEARELALPARHGECEAEAELEARRCA
jgi:hypothetical protein